MRSSRGAALCSLLLGLVLACDSQDRRITDICVTLNQCTGYVTPEACRDMVSDALKDRRITDGEMARCSECLGEHEGSFETPPGVPDPEDCYDILVERDCDKACEAVPVALRVKTHRDLRKTMCEAIGEACGLSFVAGCTGGVEREFQGLALEAQLELDGRIADCRQCVVAPGREPAQELDDDVAACSALLAGCRERCRQVRSVSSVLEVSANIVAVCTHDTSCYFPQSMMPGTSSGGAPTDRADSCIDDLAEWLQAAASPGGGRGGGSGEDGGASGGGAGGQCGDAGDGAGGEAAGCGGPAPKALTRSESLAECARCVGALSCDVVSTICAGQCSAVAGAR